MRCTPSRTLGSTLAVASILAALATGAAAQDWKGRGGVQGVVVSEDDEPIAGASVTLRPQGRPDIGPEPIITDKAGRWSYLGLSGGTWTVLIEHPEYVAAEGTVSVSESGASRRRGLRTTLRSLASMVDPEVERRAAALRSQLERGNSLLAEGRYGEARTEFESALTELDEANQPLILLAIARTYYQEEKVEETLASLERVLAIEPNNVEALRLISSLLVSEGRTDEAEQYMARLPEDEKLDPNALLNVGIEEYNAQDLDAALVAFDAAVRDYPDFADAYYYRGLVHLNIGHNKLSAVDFKKLLELAPDHPNAEEAKQFLEYLESQ